METIKNKNYTKSESYKISHDLNEDWMENGLLLAGFIPVIGEIADIILIIKFLKEKRYIEAGLMLVALIPTVGDFLIKPFLKLGKAAGAFNSTGKLMKFLSTDAKAAEMYAKTGKYFNNPKLNQLIGDVSKVSPKWGKEMNTAKNLHLGLVDKVGDIIKIGPGKSIKQTFQKKALGNYLIKTGGVEPSTFLSRWWNVNYKGARLRKNFFTKVLLGDKILKHLGIINIEDLEKKMSTPEGASELLKDPTFVNLFNKTTSQKEKENLGNMYSPDNQQEPNMLPNITSIGGGFLGINALKMVAKLVL